MARPTQAAIVLALAALLMLSACGRKGALESPNTAAPGTEKKTEPVESNPEIDRVLGKP